MNKNEFLKELRQSISMLEDGEQTDIIDEYSQHIDMKVEGGMTEAEAIADFGPLDQLVEEVLGAYHVKAPERKPASDTQSLFGGSRQAAGTAVDAAKRGVSKLKGAAASMLESAKAITAKPKAAGVADGAASVLPERGSKPNVFAKIREAFSNTMSGISQGSLGLWGACVTVAKACMRWCWNAFVACVAFCALAGAVCAVFAFGFCVVLMLQGYPLMGVTIALLGSIAALTCLALLSLRFVLLKRKPAPDHRKAASNENLSNPCSCAMTANEVM